MMRPRSWRPVLQGELADRAHETVDAIADGLREVTPGAYPALASGAAGMAVLFAYLAKARPGSGAWEIAERHLEAAIDAVGEWPLEPTLYGGFTGVAWAVEHLQQMAGSTPDEDPNEEVDEVLLAALGATPWTRHYDLVSGLVGLGVYALSRRPRASADACLERVVDRLDELSERLDGGVAWRTPIDQLPEHRQHESVRSYNLGLAHGVPGVIAVLGDVWAAGIAREKAGRLLEEAVAWTLKQRLPDEEGGAAFAYDTTLGEPPKPSRLAWCYGDPGVSAALLVAARAVGRPDWERVALELALRSATKPQARAGVKDASLCHGSAGLGLIFQRQFVATGDERLADAARDWYRTTLELRTPAEGIGGYRFYRGEESGWEDRAALLDGSAGVALALLAATGDVEPAWDRTLLISGA